MLRKAQDSSYMGDSDEKYYSMQPPGPRWKKGILTPESELVAET